MQNTVSGVLIEAAGSKESLETFIRDIPKHCPPASQIEQVSHSHIAKPIDQFPPDFSIIVSSETGTRTAFIPPDMDVCHQCVDELFEPQNRRFNYPFINCTNCGPRYTLIRDLPYDRSKTSMESFPLCNKCAEEYHSPDNRRFHAQPNACKDCGPQLSLIDSKGIASTAPDPIIETQSLLNQGKVLAIKGIGGFHLAVSASDPTAVDALRTRKNRPAKPFAIMCADLSVVAQLAHISSKEREVLESQQKPIVLLNKKSNCPLPKNIAPDNNYIGVMLPYSPLHHLLFKNAPYDSLVFTSGNLSEEPIVIETTDALSKLSKIADYFLTNNRDILTSNDDSVVYCDANTTQFIRRSRSFSPAPITLNFDSGRTLAVGGALKNTLCLTKGNQYFLSQHIGDLQHFESTTHFNKVAKHLQELLLAKPDLVAHDLHPDYYSTTYAKALGLPTVAVQHHHAHAVSCMAENGIDDNVIAIVLDGTGLGSDGTIWGGEILTATHSEFTRNAHFENVALPGGDSGIKEPWRMALSYLLHTFGETIPDNSITFFNTYSSQVDMVRQMIVRNINSPLTSSCGRLFDAVSSLLGLNDTISFEAQAAANLEMIADPSPQPPYSFDITNRDNRDCFCISFKKAIEEILFDLSKNVSASIISRRFHETIATAVAEVSLRISQINGIKKVVLSGGSFQNRLLLGCTRSQLIKKDFLVYTHKQVPTNDGGLCLGQALIGRSTHTMKTNLHTDN